MATVISYSGGVVTARPFEPSLEFENEYETICEMLRQESAEKRAAAEVLVRAKGWTFPRVPDRWTVEDFEQIPGGVNTWFKQVGFVPESAEQRMCFINLLPEHDEESDLEIKRSFRICANPECVAIKAKTDMKRCTRCKVPYCNRVCQKAHWRSGHSAECGDIRDFSDTIRTAGSEIRDYIDRM